MTATREAGTSGPPISVMQLVYSLQIGGSEKLALDISSHLNPARFAPSMCALDLDGDLAQELTQLGIPHFVAHRRGVEPAVMGRLYRLFRDNRVDVVHTHHFAQLFYAALPARAAGARIIHTEHEFFTYTVSRTSRTLLRPLLRFCEQMTVVGPEVASYFIDTIGVPASRIAIVRNGVNPARFDYDAAAARAELGLGPHDFVMGTIGRLEPEKDQATLLEVFKQVHGCHSNARLVIVGDGQLGPELKAQAQRLGIADRTMFLGYRRDIARVLAAMDVFLLPSIREGLPISLIEAMAARRPVVASDIGSVRDLLREGEAGFMVKPRDIQGFTAAVSRFIADPSLGPSMARNGRSTVEASFSLASSIHAYERLYQTAVTRPDVRH